MGIMHAWSVDLDPLSMLTLIMAVGFSVDYTAHVTYHYAESNKAHTIDARLHATFDPIRWPMLQAGISTTVCILPLAMHDVYISHVFMKTICVVVALGLLHGLVLLP